MNPPRRVSFSDAVSVTFRTAIRHLWLCLLVVLAPSLLSGVAITVLDGLGAKLVDGVLFGFGASVAIFAASVAAIGTLVVAGVVAYPVALAGLSVVAISAVREQPVERPAVWDRMLDRGPAAIGTFLLATLVVVAAPALLTVAAVVAALLAGPVAGAAVGVLAAASLVWPAFVWWVRFTLAIPAVVDDDLGPVAALERSADVVKGGFWWVLGVILFASVGGAILSGIVGLPFAFASPAQPGMAVFAAVGQTLGIAVSLIVTGLATGVAYAMRATPPAAAGIQEEFDFTGAPGG